jgi:hypothetical protein
MNHPIIQSSILAKRKTKHLTKHNALPLILLPDTQGSMILYFPVWNSALGTGATQRRRCDGMRWFSLSPTRRSGKGLQFQSVANRQGNDDLIVSCGWMGEQAMIH